MLLDTVAEALEKLGPPKLIRQDFKARGVHLDVTLRPDQVRAFASVLRRNDFLIEDVGAVDGNPEMMVVYHFIHPVEGLQVQGRALIDRSKPEVPSIQETYPGANWHEREAHDFHGIAFLDHPDLSPLILPEDAADTKPLFKSDADVKSIGALIPEFGPPKPEGAAAEGEGEGEAKPRPKKERPPKPGEGEA